MCMGTVVIKSMLLDVAYVCCNKSINMCLGQFLTNYIIYVFNCMKLPNV